jgi:hypothetical protein
MRTPKRAAEANVLRDLERQLDDLRAEVRSARADTAASFVMMDRMAKTIRVSRRALVDSELQAGWDRLRPDVSLVRWQPRKGTVESPELGSGLIDRLKAGESVAAVETVTLTDSQNNIAIGGGGSMPGGIVVYDGTHTVPIITIDDTGMRVYDLVSDPSASSYLLIVNGSIYAVRPGVTDLLVADIYGINASSITGGSIGGGSNLIPDGSMEMADFPSTVPSTKVWTTTADWDGWVTSSDENVDGVTDALQLTTATY